MLLSSCITFILPARPLCSWTHEVNTEGARATDWLISVEDIIFSIQLLISSSVKLFLHEQLHDTNISQILLICEGVSTQILSRLPCHQYPIMFLPNFWPSGQTIWYFIWISKGPLPLAMSPPGQNPSTPLEVMPTEWILFHHCHFFFYIWKSWWDISICWGGGRNTA